MKRYIVILLFFTVHAIGQTGPAGVGTNNGTSFLKVWLDATKGVCKDYSGKQMASDNERVLFWSDLSNSGNHVRATSDITRPTLAINPSLMNGQSALRFTRDGGIDNKANFMESSSFSKTDDITIYCVFYALGKGGGSNYDPKPVQYAQGDSMWFLGSGLVVADVSGSPTNDISLTLTDTSLAAGAGDSISHVDFTVKTPSALKNGFFAVLEKQRQAGLLSISKNGELPVTYPVGKEPLNSSFKYTIGSTQYIASDLNYFDGYIANVLVFNKKLTDAERIIVDNYLSAKYAIPLARNDLYKMDDVALGNYDFDLAAIGKGNDGLPQSKAKGEGIVELSNASSLKTNEYLFWAHNNQSLSYQVQDVPEGVRQRIVRTWRVSEIGETGLVDLVVDTKSFPNEDQDLVLLVDTDNNGLFENETLGNGMCIQSKYLGNGQYLFQKVNLNNENRFTFGTMKPACQADCDAVFTPNGDGISDTYFIDNVGKMVILDKFGQLIRELTGPTYWDGIKSNGTHAKEGLYFIISNDSHQKTVTLLK